MTKWVKDYIILNWLFYSIEIILMFAPDKSYEYGGNPAGNMSYNRR